MSIVGFRLPQGEAVALPPDIAFLLAQGVPLQTLTRAAAIARSSGTDAATALLGARLMGEEPYYRALARALGMPFLRDGLALGPGTRFPESIVAGAAPLALGGPANFVLAPRGPAIAELLAGRSCSGRRQAITTPTRLREAVFAARPREIATLASDTLEIRRPDWAYRPGPRRSCLALLGLALVSLIALLASLPTSILLAALVAAQIGFLALLTFRVAAASLGGLTIEEPEASEDGPPIDDRDLPVYTVLVALYREARVVPRIVWALANLDYPAAKLDIIFAIEADDAETAAALSAVSATARFDVVVAPPGEPRTKPRALNVALPLARGTCLVVYDAEDVPDPGQLRAAATRFARAPATTACLQGRLVIDNARDSWLTRWFALEYSALFDVLGPALARWQLPTPLGGTSTHFRTQVLRAVHGWDAWNVTEDADLGLRLALAGYHVGDLPSATIEEAPAHMRPWLRQRTRWMKGFLQTSLTHGRHPIATARRLGPLGTLCAVAMLPGTFVSALAYPVLTGWTVLGFLTHGLPEGPDFWSNLPSGASTVVFAAGFVAMLLPALLGCIRRRWWDLLVFVPMMPLYFLLVSLAAWLGLIELIRAPARWNKTEHGLSATSRSGALRGHAGSA